MDLRMTILKENSKAQCDKIVRWVGSDPTRFNELFHLFMTAEYRVVQRAAWPISYCVEAHPEFIKPHFAALIKQLKRTGIHDAVKRNSIRLLQEIAIPKKYQGAIMDICFGYLASPSEPVAIKVFSMTVLKNLSDSYPEILPELKLIILDQLSNASAGFRSRAKNLKLI